MNQMKPTQASAIEVLTRFVPRVLPGALLVALALNLGCSRPGAIGEVSSSASNSGQGSGGGIGSGSGGNNGGGSGGVSAAEAWSKAEEEMSSSPEIGSYQGQKFFDIDRASQSLRLFLPFPSGFDLTINLPAGNSSELPGVSFGAVADEQGNRRMAIIVPLRYILKGGAPRLGNVRLPNGDPLPFLPAGERTGISFPWPGSEQRIYLYIVNGAVAVFIETPRWRNNMIGIGWPIKNQQKNRVVGYLGLVPSRGSFPSGVYLAARLPAEIARLLVPFVP